MRGDREIQGRIRKKVEEKLRPLTVPNFITMVRMAIVPFLVIAILDQDFKLACWIFGVASLSDVLDGWLARRLEVPSMIGAVLDPVADKLLLTTAYVALTIPLGQAVVIPLWLAILALFRDFLILLVALVLYMFEDIKKFPPSVLGKATTAMNVATVAAVLLANVFEIPVYLVNAVFYFSFTLVIMSGVNYIYRASKLIQAARAEREHADP